jgi:hypothetical protein
MSTSKRYYALSDKHTGDYPENSTNGLPYSKEVIFFPSANARDEWLKETKLLTAIALTRFEAIDYSRQLDNGDRVARPARRPGEELGSDYVICKSQSRHW